MCRATEFPPYAAEDIACPSCGNAEPARLGDGGCEACIGFPRCGYCGAWADLVPSVRVAFADGSGMDVCDACVGKMAVPA